MTVAPAFVGFATAAITFLFTATMMTKEMKEKSPSKSVNETDVLTTGIFSFAVSYAAGFGAFAVSLIALSALKLVPPRH